MRLWPRAWGHKTITVELECLDCGAHESVELSSEKFKVLSSSWKLVQDCRACGKPTDWTFAKAEVDAAEEIDFWDWLATTGEYFEPASAGPQPERRSERRIDVRVPLRIATSDGEEEEVTSFNISKNGLCFSSGKTYEIGTTLEVTLQPPGAPAPQSKTATIVRASATEEGKNLYGARIMT